VAADHASEKERNIMGTFVTNLHVRDADRNAVIEALRSLDVVPAYVRDSPENTWISIFPEAADQDEAALSEIARSLSKALSRPVIAFLVHDSDIFLYWLYNGGKELDRYNSAPGFFAGTETPPEGGNPEMLRVCCPPGLSTDRLLRVLHPERIALEQPASTKVDRETGIKDALRKKMRESYPTLAAKMPNPPSLEEFLAEAEKRLADMHIPGEGALAAAEVFVFAEDRLVEFARLLGIPDGPAIDSYSYLVEGEGSPGSFTFVDAEGERSIHLE
jgi:hypothetical protein